MKKILSVILMICLLCSASAAFAGFIPEKLSDIAGLPALPDVPTMRTKNDGKTATVTLSAPLESLVVVGSTQKTGFYSVKVEFGENKLVGTYSLKDNFPKNQPGVSSFARASRDHQEVKKYTAKEARAEKIRAGKKSETIIDGPYSGGAGTGGQNQTHIETDTTRNPDGTFTVMKTVYSRTVGYTEMGYAYEGETEDGIIVRYNRKGDIVGIIMRIPGENYLNDDPEPEAMEVTWIRNGNGKLYICNIASLDEDGSVITEANYHYSGKLKK